jgi:hypothetical protein
MYGEQCIEKRVKVKKAGEQKKDKCKAIAKAGESSAGGTARVFVQNTKQGKRKGR